MTYRFSTATLSGRQIIKRQNWSSSTSNGVYEASPRDFVNSFYAVLRRWKNETAFCSDPGEITAHPSYHALVQHAHLTLGLIIGELRLEPSFLVWVLDDALGE